MGSHRDPMSHNHPRRRRRPQHMTTHDDGNEEHRDQAGREVLPPPSQRYVFIGLLWPVLTSPTLPSVWLSLVLKDDNGDNNNDNDDGGDEHDDNNRLPTSLSLENAELRLGDDRMYQDGGMDMARRVRTIVAQRLCFSRSWNRVSMTAQTTGGFETARTMSDVVRDSWEARLARVCGRRPSCWPYGTSLDVSAGESYP